MKIIKEGDISQAPWLGAWICFKCGCEIVLEPEDVRAVTGKSGTKLWMSEGCPSCGQLQIGWNRPEGVV